MRTTIITGATGGVGSEIARKLAYAVSDNVTVCGRSRSKLNTLMEELPFNATAYAGGLGDYRELVSETLDLYRLVLCHGTYKDDAMMVNAVLTVDIINAAFPHMIPGGQIVHINSAAGVVAREGEALYAASKHAMTGYLRALRPEAKKRGIRVLDVFPGAIKTPMCEGSPNYENMMSPVEVADAVVDAMKERSTLQVGELHLFRTN